MNWYLSVLKNYAGFSGRARRKEYWYFVLIHILILLVLVIIDTVALGTEPGSVPVLTSIYSLAVLIPGLAVAVRRLHDQDKSGWWVLIGMIPVVNLVGGLVLFIFMLLDGTPGPNRHGPSPKEEPHYAGATA